MDRSQYPRFGYRLAPSCLKEALQIPISGSGAERSLKLSDLDESSWARFAANDCRRFAQVIVRRLTAQMYCLPRKTLTRQLPEISSSICPHDLELESRTRNRLLQMMSNAGLKGLEELQKLTIGQILETSGFGPKCLVDLLSSLEAVSIYASWTNKDRGKLTAHLSRVRLKSRLTLEAARLKELQDAALIRLDDPRLARHLRPAFRLPISLGNGGQPNNWDSLLDLADRMASRGCDCSDLSALCSQLRTLRTYLTSLSGATLEKELCGIITAVKNQRAAKIFLRCQGWDGNAPCTGRIAGAQFGIKASAVNQICADISERLAQKNPWLPTLDKTLAYLSTIVPAPACEIEQALTKKRLAGKNFRLEGLLCAARFFGRPSLFRIENCDGMRIAIPQETPGLTRKITRIAVDSMRRRGTATLRGVAEQATRHASLPISSEFVSKVLRSRPDFVWLSQDTNCFWLSSVGNNRLFKVVRKVLSICPRIRIDELLTAAVRNRRLAVPAIESNVLLKFCRELPICHVLRDTVLAKEAIDPQAALGRSEFLMSRILNDNGPLLSSSTYRDMCLHAGINENTFYSILRASPVIAEPAAGVYGSVGAHVPLQIGRVVAQKAASEVIAGRAHVSSRSVSSESNLEVFPSLRCVPSF
jgi:hypothetical protein